MIFYITTILIILLLCLWGCVHLENKISPESNIPLSSQYEQVWGLFIRCTEIQAAEIDRGDVVSFLDTAQGRLCFRVNQQVRSNGGIDDFDKFREDLNDDEARALEALIHEIRIDPASASFGGGCPEGPPCPPKRKRMRRAAPPP